MSVPLCARIGPTVVRVPGSKTFRFNDASLRLKLPRAWCDFGLSHCSSLQNSRSQRRAFSFHASLLPTSKFSSADSFLEKLKEVEESYSDDLIMPSDNDIGIMCFANSQKGFQAVLKQRYSDFLVHEVDESGNVVELTSLEVPADIRNSREETVVEQSDLLPLSNGFGTQKWVDSKADREPADLTAVCQSFGSFASEEDLNLLTGFLAKVDCEDLGSLPPLLFGASTDKDYRTRIHLFMKRHLPFTVTDTVDHTQGLKAIRVRVKGAGKRGRGDSSQAAGGKRPRFDHRGDKGADPWKDKDLQLMFHLYKENVETQHAVSILSKRLGIQGKCFGFAGTKDKRGITVQRVTVFRQTAERLASLNASLFNMKLGNFRYVKDRLVLGQLGGNRFIIVLRNVQSSGQAGVDVAVEALLSSGFVNYFGHQRFGSGSVGSHKVGAALLRGEWQAAVDLLLMPRDGEREDIAAARTSWQQLRNPRAALRLMPRQMVAEQALLSALLQQMEQHNIDEARDCSGFNLNLMQAISCIPRPLRTMYVHSYQSYLWNMAASHRVDTYGCDKAVEGDLVLVLVPVQEPPLSTAVAEDGEGRQVVEQAAAAGSEPVTHETEEECEDEGEGGSQVSGSRDSSSFTDGHGRTFLVKVVSSADVAESRFSIQDVVLPLFGNSVKYPENSSGQVFASLTSKDGIQLGSSSHKVKEFSVEKLKGDYRKLIAMPEKCSWEVLAYSDSEQALVQTDLERLQSKGATALQAEEARGAGQGAVQGSSGQKEMTALKLQFVLPTSSYATMAVRELLKASSSVEHQKTLNSSQ